MITHPVECLQSQDCRIAGGQRWEAAAWTLLLLLQLPHTLQLKVSLFPSLCDQMKGASCMLPLSKIQSLLLCALIHLAKSSDTLKHALSELATD